MTRFKKTAAGVLTAALCITLIVPAGAEGAAKKPKLSKSRLSVKTGKTATLKAASEMVELLRGKDQLEEQQKEDCEGESQRKIRL